MKSSARSTDEELLHEARQGGTRAFRTLVERYEGAVASTVVGMLGPGPEAEDVGQETFVRFYRAMDAFRGDSSLRTYLTRIAINQSLKVLKKRKTWRQHFQLRSDTSPLHEPTINGEAIADRRERVQLVHRALDRLSAAHRAVVVLRMIEGYSTRETAQLLGVAQGTVMSRLSRAMKALRSIIRPWLDDE